MLRNFTDYATIPSSASGMLRNFTDCAIMFPFDSRHVTKLHGLLNDGCQIPRSGQAKVACHQTMVLERNWGMTTAVVEDDPFRFFDDFAIWWSFSEFQSVKSKEEWKWGRLGFLGRVWVKNWGRYEVLKIRDEGGTRKRVWLRNVTGFIGIYRGGRDVIDYKVS